MSNPSILLLISAVFAALGVYSIFSGLRKLRQAKANGQQLVWYKQVNLLTGIEYILLALVFLMNVSISLNILPSVFKNVTLPFYLLILLSSAVIAGFVIRQSLQNARTRQATSQAVVRNETVDSEAITSRSVSDDDAIRVQRRRERRQKAAAARRRHAGKA